MLAGWLRSRNMTLALLKSRHRPAELPRILLRGRWPRLNGQRREAGRLWDTAEVRTPHTSSHPTRAHTQNTNTNTRPIDVPYSLVNGKEATARSPSRFLQDTVLTCILPDQTPAERTQTGALRASLDVEGFKNLLMAGIPSSRGSGPPPPQNAPAPTPVVTSTLETNSSSTDTSSVSRQSLFEPVHDPSPESSSTSYEMAASDDERITFTGDPHNVKEKKKPPPAPKPRHGKPVGVRAPQTVAFEGFAATEPTSSPSSRRDLDWNRPLPSIPPTPPPQTHTISQDGAADPPSMPDFRASDPTSPSEAAPAQKKLPPPVPLSRRHSQLRNSTVGGDRAAIHR